MSEYNPSNKVIRDAELVLAEDVALSTSAAVAATNVVQVGGGRYHVPTSVVVDVTGADTVLDGEFVVRVLDGPDDGSVTNEIARLVVPAATDIAGRHEIGIPASDEFLTIEVDASASTDANGTFDAFVSPSM